MQTMIIALQKCSDLLGFALAQKSLQNPPEIDVTSLFYSGNYLDAASLADRRGSALKQDEWPAFIGALAFSGRLQDARAHFERRCDKMSRRAQIESRFYLGVGSCRHSDYAAARMYFAKNLRASRPAREASTFFVHQGIAFYRYFCGRFSASLRAAEKAWLAASSSNFLFGKAFASDLLGHSLIESGEVHAGLARLKEASKWAAAIGNGGLCVSFHISHAIQSARFGIDPHAIASLSDLLKAQQVQDVYSRSGLLLELARQYYLRGLVDEAKATLDDACRSIYGFKHRRYSVVLNLRYAYLLKLRGDIYQALTLVRSAREQLDPEVDLTLEVECRGLERALCASLDLPYDDSRLRFLTQKTARFVAKRMERRHGGLDASLTPPLRGQDPLGDMKDDLAKAGRACLPSVAKSGFWGLLWDVPGLVSSEMALHFDLLEDTVVLVDHGHVDTLPKLSSPIFRALLLRLARGACSKEDLIREVWGYRYAPLKHDALVYTTVSRLRQALGSRERWVQCLGGIYGLSADVRVHGTRPSDGVPEDSKPAPASRYDLNYRQRQILRFLSESGSSDVRSCLQKFDVSDMTVRRDFRELLERSLVRRIGRGRAIKYILKETQDA